MRLRQQTENTPKPTRDRKVIVLLTKMGKHTVRHSTPRASSGTRGKKLASRAVSHSILITKQKKLNSDVIRITEKKLIFRSTKYALEC